MTGVGIYGPPRFVLQLMNGPCVCPSFGVMSPLAPALIAKIGWTPRYPLVTMTKPGPTIGVGIVISELPDSRHNSLPVAGSYPRVNVVACVTSSVRPSCSKIAGVDHDGISSRAVRQTGWPVATSNAAINELFWM